MKRILFFLFFCMTQMLISQEKNIISREYFDSQEILFIETKLLHENIEIRQSNQNQITIEIGSNNRKKIPIVYKEGVTLKIQQESLNYTKGDFSSIYIYIPKHFQPQVYHLETRYGNITGDQIRAQDSIEIINSEGSVSFDSVECDDFYCFIDGNSPLVTIKQLKCSFFNASAICSDFSLGLAKAPLAKSTCSTKNGKITISIPETESFELNLRSNNSLFINKFNNSRRKIPEDYTYIHNSGGPQIFLQTFTGDIQAEKGAI